MNQILFGKKMYDVGDLFQLQIIFWSNILFIILIKILTMKIFIRQKNMHGMMWVAPIEMGLSAW